MGFSLEQLRKLRIGVLLGGLSSEREVSLRTGNAVVKALQSRGYDVRAIDVGRDLAQRLATDPIDVAFIALHGRYGEDGSIQGLLESMFIPYTGSGVLASAAAMDKVFTKRVFMAEDIPVADHVAFRRDEEIKLSDVPFGLPCVVKPSREGSSVGVSVVKTPEEFGPAVEEARKHPGEVLVERYVKGREVNVAVLFGKALGAIEIRPSREFYDYTAKYTPGLTQYLYPAPLPPDVYEMVLQMGARAHEALGCDGATRADLIVTEGSMIVLEVNTLPGMTETSLLPKIAAGQGIDFPSLCEQLLCGASLKA
jgi:D-alanine-D-alanine ligase